MELHKPTTFCFAPVVALVFAVALGCMPWGTCLSFGPAIALADSATQLPSANCDTEDDIVAFFRACHEDGVSDFDLYLSEDLFEKVRANGSELLFRLEAYGGVDEREASSYSSGRIEYRNTTYIDGPILECSTIEDVQAGIATLTEADKNVTIICTEELYNTLREGTEYPAHEGMIYLLDITDSAGILNFDGYHLDKSHVLVLENIVFYPGQRIVWAVRDGKVDTLDQKLYDTYQLAQSVADAARAQSQDPVQIVKYIHDWLCAHVTYYMNDDGADDNDTAVGAFLDGLADCDGYADAFYLAATLAGVEVRYQHGDEYDEDNPDTLFASKGLHMWNFVKIDGQWYVVDVTWDDDEDNRHAPTYRWFVIGEDRDWASHVWNRRTSVPIAGQTDVFRRPANEYILDYMDEGDQIAYDICANGFEQASVYIYDPDPDHTCDVIFQALFNYGMTNGYYSWDDATKLLSLYIEY